MYELCQKRKVLCPNLKCSREVINIRVRNPRINQEGTIMRLEEAPKDPNFRIIRSVNVTASHWSILKTICDKHGYKMSRVFDNLVKRFIRDKS